MAKRTIETPQKCPETVFSEAHAWFKVLCGSHFSDSTETGKKNAKSNQVVAPFDNIYSFS